MGLHSKGSLERTAAIVIIATTLLIIVLQIMDNKPTIMSIEGPKDENPTPHSSAECRECESNKDNVKPYNNGL